jgi:hypothetical protein
VRLLLGVLAVLLVGHVPGLAAATPEASSANPVSSPATSPASTRFDDVPAGAYFAGAVEWARTQGVTTGAGSPSRFEPHRPVSRAEAVTFLWRASGSPEARRSGMVDVPADAYFAPAVHWAQARGVTTGIRGGDRFAPGRTATRAESVTFLWRWAGTPSAPPARFGDLDAHPWAVAAIGWAQSRGVTTGVGGGDRFAPGRTVTRAEYVTMLWRAAGSPPTGAGHSPPPPPPPPPGTEPLASALPTAGRAADRMLIWANCGDVVGLTDADLDRWRKRGAGGFVCQTQHLIGMGGSHAFTGDPADTLSGRAFELQRRIRDTGIVQRAAARGMKLYLGFYTVNFNNGRTPLMEWFDDDGWSRVVIPRLRDIAGAARSLGFAGLAFDHELYPQRGGATATWQWNYQGNTRTREEVKDKVRQRGAQMMSAMVGAYPGLEIVDYFSWFPESWEALVQQTVNRIVDAHQGSVKLPLWDGLTSVEGYGAIRFLDAMFYKETQMRGATWDTALQYDLNRVFALLSRNLSNWSYASSRIHRSPFAWISDGPLAWERARSPEHVSEQLLAFRRWGMGGMYANYAWGGLGRFDYGPYEEAMRAGTQPGLVDPVAPTLAVTRVERAGDALRIVGHASDDMAIHFVSWSSSAGTSGAAQMDWQVLAGDHRTGYDWRMNWTATVPLAPGLNEITLLTQDIKGNTGTTMLTAVR